jgi:hypothetical protein
MEHLHGVPEIKVVTLRDGAVYVEWIDEARCVAVPGTAAPAGFIDTPSAPADAHEEG